MKQFAIIGISSFGGNVLEELLPLKCEILLIDKDEEKINLYKDRVAAAYIANVINQETILRLIPPQVDAVIVDLGDSTEASILVTNYLKKLGVGNIIVKAETPEHGEILNIVGADNVIFPNREAARRITPQLISDLLYNFVPIEKNLVFAEILPPEELVGKSLEEANLRRTHKINIVAIKKEKGSSFDLFDVGHVISEEEILLVVGREADILTFGKVIDRKKSPRKSFFKILRGR